MRGGKNVNRNCELPSENVAAISRKIEALARMAVEQLSCGRVNGNLHTHATDAPSYIVAENKELWSRDAHWFCGKLQLHAKNMRVSGNPLNWPVGKDGFARFELKKTF